MKLKVCGLTQPDNLKQVLELKPDYVGFIFYKHSPRFVDSVLPYFSSATKKTGVFVNSTIDFISEKIQSHLLNAIQLHGEETPEFCSELKSQSVEIIKTFRLGRKVDFNTMKPYQEVCDYYLFDTKSKKYGGSGKQFDWSLLHQYPFEKPFFISGGIDVNHITEIKTLQTRNSFLYSVDINSKFEVIPGVKEVQKIAGFKALIDEL